MTPETMRIAIANPTGGGMSGGYVKYLNGVVPELMRHPAVAAVRVFVAPTLKGPLQDLPLEAISRGDWPRHITRFGADVLFVPTARTVRCPGVPRVTMMRNMEPVTVPFTGNTVAESLRNMARAVAARRACRSADRVIAVSDFVARFLRDRWRISATSIATVPHGVEPPLPAERWARPARMADDAPFVFAAGSIRPARGLSSLLDAFGRMAPRFPGLRLVIAGGATQSMRWHAERLRVQAHALGVAEALSTGSDHCLRKRWRGVMDGRAFVMTSRAEACPNVVLEAMSYGCPCVSVRRDPMPEFFGDAAVYVASDDDAESLSDALCVVLEAPERAAFLRRRAISRASLYTWSMTALRTVEELQCATPTSGPGSQPHLPEDERVSERGFAQRVVAAGGPAVTGAHVGLEQQRIGVGLHGPQLRHEFCGFPIGHLAVVQRGLRQDRRILLRLDIVVRGIAHHVIEGLALVWISPLDILARRQRQ